MQLIPKGLSCLHSECDRVHEEIILPWLLNIILCGFIFLLTYELNLNLRKAESSFPPRFHLDLGLQKNKGTSENTYTQVWEIGKCEQCKGQILKLLSHSPSWKVYTT